MLLPYPPGTLCFYFFYCRTLIRPVQLVQLDGPTSRNIIGITLFKGYVPYIQGGTERVKRILSGRLKTLFGNLRNTSANLNTHAVYSIPPCDD